MNVSETQNILAKRKAIREKVWFGVKLIAVLVNGYMLSQYVDYFEDHALLGRILYGFNTFLTASVLISGGRFLLISWYNRRNRKGDRVRGSFVLGINQFSVILHTVFGLLGFMLITGINPKEFLTSITLVAMAIALLFKDYITNMISGLLIMFSDQFTIGDHIKMGEFSGKIVDITLSNIVVRNEDDDAVLIPNNSAFTMSMVNHSLENSRKMSVEFHLPRQQAYLYESLHQHLNTYVAGLGEKVVPKSYQLRLVRIDQESALFKVNLQLHFKTKTKKSEVKNGLLQEVLKFEALHLSSKGRSI